MKIYTKTGDSGSTGLVGGGRIEKDSARIVAIGEIDELNAVLGLARCAAANTPLEKEIARVQDFLFQLGAELATPAESKFSNNTLSDREVRYLEDSMDVMTEELPTLRNFILPGGCRLASELHVARAVCRRAEREVLTLHRSEPVREVSLRLLNRLSDWIFLAARTANRLAAVEDIKWSPEN